MSIPNTVLDTRFRAALDRMAERGRLQTYTAPADPFLEVAGIMKKLDGGPALLFSQVDGYDMPVIGNLLVSRRGEGVFGMTYSINGPAAQPRVGVNPVSALTPGILRRIFEPVRENTDAVAPTEPPPRASDRNAAASASR